MKVRDFLERYYLHYNSREVVRAARAYQAHVEGGGSMFVTLAGAMSTAQLGRVLAPAIEAGWVHGICCTGANLEEDAFRLLAGDTYEPIDDWRALRAEDEQALYDRGMNRVTDTCIPETVMRQVEDKLVAIWRRATEEGRVELPSTYLCEVLDDPDLVYHVPAEDSWLLAAKEMGVPVFTPGWEDSTLGNVFTAQVVKGHLPHHGAVMHGTHQMQVLLQWYREHCGMGSSRPSVGFFQVGGGIAGDFAICAVPLWIQDLEEPVPLWGYFAQISDAVTSYGGYSGAPPNEKITWGKLGIDTPKFMVQSDASICAPLVFAYVLGD